MVTCKWKAYFPINPNWKGMIQIENRLEEIRKQRGLTQEELAMALNVTRQTIGSLENGRYNPSVILAIKIARYFRMTVEEIFIYKGEDEHE